MSLSLGAARRRKLAIIAGPCGVSSFSGWNCTPSTLCVLCRSPIISPSAVRAVTLSSAGREPGAAISE